MKDTRNDTQREQDYTEKGARIISGSGSESPPPPPGPSAMARTPAKTSGGTPGNGSTGNAAPVAPEKDGQEKS